MKTTARRKKLTRKFNRRRHQGDPEINGNKNQLQGRSEENGQEQIRLGKTKALKEAQWSQRKKIVDY